MPTNILRSASQRRPAPGRAAAGPQRIVLVAGKITLELDLASSDTVSRLVAALPLFSTAELWGDALHFEVPVRSGRDRSARMNAIIGEVYFWAEEERIIVPWGATPISKAGECRLPAPCNVMGRVVGDVATLNAVGVAEKVALKAAQTR